MDYTINVHGHLLSLKEPIVMGILNATPDSFYAGSRVESDDAIAARANEIISEGGTIIDVGAFSTRPGGKEVTQDEEMRRLRKALRIVRREQPNAVISIDTFRSDVAKMTVEEFGADIINDVSEGGITGIVDTPMNEKQNIFATVAKLQVPYILMSVKSNLKEMMIAFAKEVQQLRDLGQKDIILDPGFGFGKTIDENYAVLRDMRKLEVFELPLLAGMSRKRMIWQLFGTSADEALNGTTIVDTIALMNGASILRVHDVKEAVETVMIYLKIKNKE
jgi:dihydropteroate synthase